MSSDGWITGHWTGHRTGAGRGPAAWRQLGAGSGEAMEPTFAGSGCGGAPLAPSGAGDHPDFRLAKRNACEGDENAPLHLAAPLLTSTQLPLGRTFLANLQRSTLPLPLDREASMRKALLHTIGIVGALLAWSPDVVAQASNYYAPYPLAQPYPPNYYQPPPNYGPPPNYYAAPNYAQPPNYAPPLVPNYAPRAYLGSPPAPNYGAPVYGYIPPPAAYYVPPALTLAPLRPRSCGKYRYWNGEYCADARYDRPYLGPKW